MIEHLPPRRDPRILAVVRVGGALFHAAADAWEVRGLGRLAAATLRTHTYDLLRLALAVRPTHVVVTGGAVAPPRARPRPLGPPLVVLATREAARLTRLAPTLAELRARHPELRGVAVPPPLTRALRLAVAALVHLPLPPRRYAPT